MPSWEAPPSFAEYVRDRHRELLRFAHLLSGDDQLAADLVQDALERTGMAWKRVQRTDEPGVYVRRIIVNQYLNRRRALRRERLTDRVPEVAHVDPEPVDHGLWRAIQALPKQQRTVLVLRYYDDLSEAQAATVLGCSVGTVKSNTSRALQKLRDSMRMEAAADGH
ncbi:SigE family RNA polymerase sigma factor [Dactylosporangium sucinum]|uniref:DNA-directed RNA polymerase sigma-70 factor n=1 Tax=Dactylosporangium sucinum TaxID=1424081 RepID=A0A917T6B3_9ACTN|nr:SigE family RNA polymerase sigma factor [Dactylosporangium sucinum]GGM12009.1 DNA-directed RNA polymerase sigma-70 factor [Dactylosporangium sucinum]